MSPTNHLEDGRSVRYAVVNVGGSSHAALGNELRVVADRLRYRFEELPLGTHGTGAVSRPSRSPEEHSLESDLIPAARE
jgi:hypothetical protein